MGEFLQLRWGFQSIHTHTEQCFLDCIKFYEMRASLVAQWLRIRLPVQGTRVRALVREDPTRHGATKPARHNY